MLRHSSQTGHFTRNVDIHLDGTKASEVPKDIIECSDDCPAQDIQKLGDREDSAEPAPSMSSGEAVPNAAANDLYQPLEDWQTRVLELEPGRYEDPLVSKLHTVDLLYDSGVLVHGTRTRIFYDALSYCWGDPTRCKQLWCNGQINLIPREAFRALRRIRSQSEKVQIWIDAICINQGDSDEKARQVRKMLTIYKKAARVRVWLGEDQGWSQLVARYLTHLAISDHEHRRETSDPSERSGWHRLCTRHATGLVDGVLDVLVLPCFKRVWVLQEVWAAQKIDVFIGDAHFPWQAIAKLDKNDALCFPQGESKPFIVAIIGFILDSVRFQLSTGDPATHAMAESKTRRPNRRVDDSHEQRLDIINVIRRSGGGRCALPHDRIFGLLGMAADPVQEQPEDASHDTIFVNYRRPAHVVYQNLVRYIIQRDNCLTVLYLDELCRRQGAADKPALPPSSQESLGPAPFNLPSWVPDFRHDPGHTQCLYDFAGCYRRYFSNTSCELAVHEDEDALHLRGIQLGVITKAGVRELEDPFRRASEYRGYPGIEYSSMKLDKKHIHGRQWLYANLPSDHHEWHPATVDLTMSLSATESTNDEEAADDPLAAWRRFIGGTEYTWYWHVPPEARDGDAVVVVQGGRLPLVLRARSDAKPSFEYIGPTLPPDAGDIRYLPNGPTVSVQVCVSDVLEDSIRRDALMDIILR